MEEGEGLAATLGRVDVDDDETGGGAGGEATLAHGQRSHHERMVASSVVASWPETPEATASRKVSPLAPPSWLVASSTAASSKTNFWPAP